jgi:hypothetical protein
MWGKKTNTWGKWNNLATTAVTTFMAIRTERILSRHYGFVIGSAFE